MEDNKESKMISAAAFVEGGIQDSCDDACSICLEDYCASDPSTVIPTFVNYNSCFSNTFKSKYDLYEE